MANKKISDTDEQVAQLVAKQDNPYRNERGSRLQKYRRFHEGKDYDAVEPDEMIALCDMAIQNIQAYATNEMEGRPRKYETVESFIEAAKGYLEYIKDANVDGVRIIPDVEGLCGYMGIARSTLFDWQTRRSVRYSDAIKSVLNFMAGFKKQLALKGKIPPVTFATDFNNNHGYTQKQEVVVTPNTPLGETPPEKLPEKYIGALPEGEES